MPRWIDNNTADKLYMLQDVAKMRNIDPESIEKDWWVTAVLKALFSLSASQYMLFKGGTSLSKGWDLINRFSEDIDIALYRDFFLKEKNLQCAKCENNNQIKLLRKASRDYVLGELKTSLENKLNNYGLKGVILEGVSTRDTKEGPKTIDHDSDPTVLLVHYPSIFKNKHQYVKPTVKIEISCLSMREPFENKQISSLIYSKFPQEDNDTISEIPTISPSRTFLEKAFLLNEEYQRQKPRTMRMSRHLYDLEKIMDTEYGQNALADYNLYESIIAHREKFYHVSGVDYSLNMPDKIEFCPQGDILKAMELDYNNMKSSFIYGTPLSFKELILRLETLQGRFRGIKK